MAEGLTVEIAACLSAWRYFPVISRNSALRHRRSELRRPRYRGVARGTLLSERDVPTGGQPLKVSVSLTDTDVDQQIWAQPLTVDLDALVDLEEEIAGQVATLVAPELEGAEARRILRKPAGDLTAWELAIRASWLIKQGAEADFTSAERLASEAVERAPEWTPPYTLIAIARFQQAMLGFSGSDTRLAFSDTLVAAKEALEIDRSPWIAHALTAVGELWTNHNHDRALLHVNKAVGLNRALRRTTILWGASPAFWVTPKARGVIRNACFGWTPFIPTGPSSRPIWDCGICSTNSFLKRMTG